MSRNDKSVEKIVEDLSGILRSATMPDALFAAQTLVDANKEILGFFNPAQVVMPNGKQGYGVYFYARNLVEKIFEAIAVRSEILKADAAYENFENESHVLASILGSREKTLRIDFVMFIAAVKTASSEDEILSLLEYLPSQFAGELLDFWSNQECKSSFGTSEFVDETIVKCKEVVYKAAVATNSSSMGSMSYCRFSSWLSGIPLLAESVITPLDSEYWGCSLSYANFSDCYSGWDEKSFRDGAIEAIKKWLAEF